MWTLDQRKRLVVEHEVLQREGFDQFSVYYDRSADTYYAAGTATANSGRHYRLYIPIPSGYPYEHPPMYVTDPNPLRMANGSLISALGVSHQMHTLQPWNGWVQICHWRTERWHSGILLMKVFLKGLVWIEAYEQHLATGRPLAEFVLTMAERA
jgi:ubiquitin-protein ligase